MGKRSNSRVRPQNPKGLENTRRVQELRRSNAAGPVPSGARYSRADFRNRAQRGQWED